MERLYRGDDFLLTNRKTVQRRWLLINQWKDSTDKITSKLNDWGDFLLTNGKTVQMGLLLFKQWKNCTADMTSN